MITGLVEEFLGPDIVASLERRFNGNRH